jgi:hypothetical protein
MLTVLSTTFAFQFFGKNYSFFFYFSWLNICRGSVAVRLRASRSFLMTTRIHRHFHSQFWIYKENVERSIFNRLTHLTINFNFNYLGLVVANFFQNWHQLTRSKFLFDEGISRFAQQILKKEIWFIHFTWTSCGRHLQQLKTCLVPSLRSLSPVRPYHSSYFRYLTNLKKVLNTEKEIIEGIPSINGFAREIDSFLKQFRLPPTSQETLKIFNFQHINCLHREVGRDGSDVTFNLTCNVKLTLTDLFLSALT